MKEGLSCLKYHTCFQLSRGPAHQLSRGPVHQLSRGPVHQLSRGPAHQLSRGPVHQLSRGPAHGRGLQNDGGDVKGTTSLCLAPGGRRGGVGWPALSSQAL